MSATEDAIALLRSRVEHHRIGRSTWREMDHDVTAMRKVIELLEAPATDASTCGHCGGATWHHTIECFTDASPTQEAVSRLEECLANREAGVGAWSMVRPEDVRAVLDALRVGGSR